MRSASPSSFLLCSLYKHIKALQTGVLHARVFKNNVTLRLMNKNSKHRAITA